MYPIKTNNFNKYRSFFTPDNRLKTYKKAADIGSFIGFIAFIVVLIFKWNELKSDNFWVDYFICPSFWWVGFATVVIWLYRPISRKVRLKQREADSSIIRGLIESFNHLFGAIGFVYFMSLLVILCFLQIYKLIG